MEPNATAIAASQIMTKYQKDDYIVSRHHRVYKVLNTPQWCMLDDRSPAYMVNLVGSADEYAHRMPQAKVEDSCQFQRFVQAKNDRIDNPPPRYNIDDYLLHITSSSFYQITDLPTDCVLEHNRQPAYGYRMKDGRRCFRAQREVEDQERFTRVDRAFAALAMMQEDDPETQAAITALPAVPRVIIQVGDNEDEGTVTVKQ